MGGGGHRMLLKIVIGLRIDEKVWCSIGLVRNDINIIIKNALIVNYMYAIYFYIQYLLSIFRFDHYALCWRKSFFPSTSNKYTAFK